MAALHPQTLAMIQKYLENKRAISGENSEMENPDRKPIHRYELTVMVNTGPTPKLGTTNTHSLTAHLTDLEKELHQIRHGPTTPRALYSTKRYILSLL